MLRSIISLKNNAVFINHMDMNDKTYCEVYLKSSTSYEETEAPIYNMVLELEAIELHKMSQIIENNNGYILDLATDCISCVFQNDFPFKTDDKNNIVGFYYDINKKYPKYKLEQKEEGHRLKVERMPRYCRTDKYQYIKPIGWTLLEDVDDNNFQPLIDNIIKNKLSVNIDGRAGTGKSTFINKLVENFEKNNISFKTLAYTNKAARIINGSTIHKFIKSIGGNKALKELQYEYIIVDEISMIPEMFYKFFCIIRRLKPDIKFIIAGDFEQLLPVNDRIGCNIDC